MSVVAAVVTALARSLTPELPLAISLLVQTICFVGMMAVLYRWGGVWSESDTHAVNLVLGRARKPSAPLSAG